VSCDTFSLLCCSSTLDDPSREVVGVKGVLGVEGRVECMNEHMHTYTHTYSPYCDWKHYGCLFFNGNFCVALRHACVRTHTRNVVFFETNVARHIHTYTHIHTHVHTCAQVHTQMVNLGARPYTASVKSWRYVSEFKEKTCAFTYSSRPCFHMLLLLLQYMYILFIYHILLQILR